MLGDISIATDIYLVTGYTDMRKSIDGLCAIIARTALNLNTLQRLSYCVRLQIGKTIKKLES